MKQLNPQKSGVNEEKTIYYMPMPRRGALTVREAAVLCGKNPETIRRWVWTGKIQAEKVGNQLFINRSEIDKSYKSGGSKKIAKNNSLAEIIKRIDVLRERVRQETGGGVFDVTEMIEESRKGLL